MKRHIKRTIEDLEKMIYTNVGVLDIEAYRTKEPVGFDDRTSGERLVLKVGDNWGELWDCAWFHITGEVPQTSGGKEIVLRIDISGEACVFDGDGNPVQGLTTYHSFEVNSIGPTGKRIYKMFACAKGGEPIDIWFDAGNNNLFGGNEGGTVRIMQICELNEAIRQLYFDMLVLNDMIKCLDEKTARYQSILFTLYKATNVIKTYSDSEIEEARTILKKELGKKNGDASLKITAIGHSHIDLGWLWPIRETKRKIVRTFSTALRLMERYPDYYYGASQPQQYEWTKQLYPKLYEEIKQRVKEGRWEVQGGMWVEADTNVTGGESLIRQLLYGKRFFMQEFGIEVKTLWLPDVFGYSGALPQILQKSGCPYFMTQKLSWNEHNKFPHHTFKWEGIDGTAVLAHMLPENTYNGSSSPGGAHFIEQNYADSGVCDEALMLFGIGDGGGGPSANHLECMDRMRDLNGLPPIKQGLSADFFDRIVKNADDYITYRGELYLERHQGTFTTQANNKKYNRLIELGLRELEFAAVLASQVSNRPYPKDEIDIIWKEVLLYQFHDILPGSSIKRVYDESVPRYKQIYARINELIDEFYGEFAAAINAPENSYIVFNSTSFERDDWVGLGNGFAKVSVSPMGYTIAEAAAAKPDISGLKAENKLLENEKIKVEFNGDGSISAIINKALGKNLLKSGSRGNILNLYEDKGNCWDIPITYRDKLPDEFRLVDVKAYIEGVSAVVEQSYEYNLSKLTQKITLKSGGDRVDFVTNVDWHENELMLRTSFETDIFTNEVTCNIQYGKFKRSCLENTSIDVAQFEIPAHKFIDLSERDCGIALMNNCKYGHYAKGNVLDLNLLRSQNSPGEQADRGRHEFTYSIYAHAGNDIDAKVTQKAYELNIPLRVYKKTAGGHKAVSGSYVSADKDNIMIETVKFAEDSRDIIIRLYDSEGIPVKSKIQLPSGTKMAVLTNMLEEELSPLDVKDGTVELDFHAFEIHTVKVSIAV
jgi:alpha-mannosidase